MVFAIEVSFVEVANINANNNESHFLETSGVFVLSVFHLKSPQET